MSRQRLLHRHLYAHQSTKRLTRLPTLGPRGIPELRIGLAEVFDKGDLLLSLVD